MARYYTEISEEDFLAHIRALLLNEEGADSYEWMYYDHLPKVKIILQDLSKVLFDFENCTTYTDVNGFHDEFLQGHYELVPNFHTFWLSAGGDWEQPLNFMLYWGDNRIRAYIPKDGNMWDTKYMCAFGSEMDSEKYTGPICGEVAIQFENEIMEALKNATPDSEKMRGEVLGHITLHPRNNELIKKQPKVPVSKKIVEQPAPQELIQTPFSCGFDASLAVAYLTKALHIALKKEDYDKAVKLRDAINDIKAGKDVSEKNIMDLLR